MDEFEHIASQPSWLCQMCCAAWPCKGARRKLLATHSPTQLGILMWTYLEQVARDIPTLPVGEAFERFIAWTWECRPTDGFERPGSPRSKVLRGLPETSRAEARLSQPRPPA